MKLSKKTLRTKLNHQNGFTLVELMVVLLLMGIVAASITTILVFNAKTSKTYSMFNDQQSSIQQVLIQVGKDIEEASKLVIEKDNKSTSDILNITFDIPDKDSKKWSFDNNQLLLDDQVVVDDIITSESGFIYNESENTLIIKVKPVQINHNYAVNMHEAIITQYSLRYKIVLFK